MDKINVAHSMIDSYPPNINKFPKFYSVKESIYILEPGDMIYIPPGWFHWIHSYPDNNENMALSFPSTTFNPPIFNQFSLEEPFIYTLDKNIYKFLSISKDNIKSNCKYSALISKSNILVPVKKNSTVPKREISLLDAETLRQNDYFISFGQNCSMLSDMKVAPPKFLLESFPNSIFTSCFWLYMYPNDTYIDSGLHYDHNPNILIQIKGKKIIRMYSPENKDKLYVSPFSMV